MRLTHARPGALTSGLNVLVAILALGWILPATAPAQPGSIYADVWPVRVDSGLLGNPDDQPKTVFTDFIAFPTSPWLRVVFDVAELEAGSYVAVKSLTDG